MPTNEETGLASFDELGLSDELRRAVRDAGYEEPTPIQSKTIPLLLQGKDVIGQAQTGTGKTAAFALPILQALDVKQNAVQALVLTPTRELAIQVSEAFHTYARPLKRVRVLPIYGGQSIQRQLTRLRSGVHVVVGTPGRVMDHLRRGTLDFSAVKLVVLDEADEMLRMGFIEDVEWILAQAPEELQTALFSATMPEEVRRIADRYLDAPEIVRIAHKTVTVPTVEQRYVMVPERQKLEALSQLLEAAPVTGEAVLVFVRTKSGAADLAEKLQARGLMTEAMHGDMSQAQRESVIRGLRNGRVELVVATDVAARGLDVERISQVINYDMPHDAEWYVHRIGRTARAGREGRAVLFVTPRERRLLYEIERYTGQPIEQMKVPTQADIAARRVELFKAQIRRVLEKEPLEGYMALVAAIAEESGRDIAEIAAAAVRLARGDKPLLVSAGSEGPQMATVEDGMVRFFIDAGRKSGVRPQDIVGAIANEAGVPGKQIGAIDIYDRFAFVEVPKEYQAQVLEGMVGVTIRNEPVTVKVAVPRSESVDGVQRKEQAGSQRPDKRWSTRKPESGGGRQWRERGRSRPE